MINFIAACYSCSYWDIEITISLVYITFLYLWRKYAIFKNIFYNTKIERVGCADRGKCICHEDNSCHSDTFSCVSFAFIVEIYSWKIEKAMDWLHETCGTLYCPESTLLQANSILLTKESWRLFFVSPRGRKCGARCTSPCAGHWFCETSSCGAIFAHADASSPPLHHFLTSRFRCQRHRDPRK